MLRVCLSACLFAVLTLHHAAAQQPTSAQRDAIRASCRTDFMAHCAGVEPGGKEAFECLLRNDAKLSAACKEAVNAVAPKSAEPAAPAAATTPPAATPETTPTPAPAPTAAAAASAPSSDQLKAVQAACTLNDLVAHCSWIAPSNPEIVLCLKANAAELSPGCQAAVQSIPANVAPGAATPAAAPPSSSPPPTEPTRRAEPAKEPAKKPTEPARASTPAPAAAPQQPTEQQKAAIRAACRSDFMSHCSGVQPGGAAALQCLQRNAASLSAGCRSAVAAIGGGGAPAAAAPAAGAPAASAAPTAAPIGPMPSLRPREALAIVQICSAEVHTICSGIPFGGGRVLTCLAGNIANLSPQCAAALRAAAAR